jgi:two-component system, LytTR family, response regulator
MQCDKEKIKTMQTNKIKLAVVTCKGTSFYSLEEIVRLQASGNYTNIYFINKKKILTAKVMKEFVTILEPLGFVKTHRSHLVNRQHISEVNAAGNIIMEDASIAAISRRMKSSVLKALKN